MDEYTYVDLYDKIAFEVITKDELNKIENIDDICSWFLLSSHYYNMDKNKCYFYTNKLKQLNIKDSDNILICLTMGGIYDNTFFENLDCIETERCQEKSLEWYMKCLNNKSGFTEYYIANKYFYGKGISRNVDISINWYNKSIKKGYHMSMMFLSFIRNDKKLCIEAIKKGNLKAMVSYPYDDIYIHMKYLERAANIGYKPAMLQLAKQYIVYYDYFLAIKLLEQLRDIKFCLKETLYYLALCHEKIDNHNYELVLDYYKKSSDLGNSEAKIELCKYYRDTDLKSYFKLLDEASYENALACNILIYHYKHTKNYELVYHYALKGHELGDENCSFIVAKCYLFGVVVEKNKEKGINMLEKLKHDDSNLILAELYLTGDIIFNGEPVGLSFNINIEKAIYYMMSLTYENLLNFNIRYPLTKILLINNIYPESFSILDDDVKQNIIEIYLCSENIPIELQILIIKQLILVS